MEQILLAVVVTVIILIVVRQNAHDGSTDDLHRTRTFIYFILFYFYFYFIYSHQLEQLKDAGEGLQIAGVQDDVRGVRGAGGGASYGH